MEEEGVIRSLFPPPAEPESGGPHLAGKARVLQPHRRVIHPEHAALDQSRFYMISQRMNEIRCRIQQPYLRAPRDHYAGAGEDVFEPVQWQVIRIFTQDDLGGHAEAVTGTGGESRTVFI